MASKSDKFKTGAVVVRFIKDFPYLNKEGKEIDKLKGNPQFKKGKKTKLRFDTAGKLSAAGYCDILDKENEPISTKEVAKESK